MYPRSDSVRSDSVRAGFVLALALGWGACSSSGANRADGPPRADAAAVADAAVDGAAAVDLAPPGVDLPTTAEFFRIDAVHRIELTVDPAEWQRFLAENRDLDGSPTWHAGDVRIDGTALPQVGFKTFGYGSRAANLDKPNLNLELDKYTNGQSYAGKSRLRVKNNGQDVSGLRQAITYEAMRAVGLWAPRSTYATVSVNGESYGFYFVEESFTKSFVRDRAGDDTGAAYESTQCQGFVPPAGGCAGIVDSYTRPFNPTVGAGEDLIALCTALSRPAAQVLSGLGPLIDTQEWARAIAADLAIAGDNDGFDTAATNFRLYHDPTSGKVRLIMYGPDTSYDPDFLPTPNPKAPAPADYCAALNPAYKDVFLQKLLGSAEGLGLYKTEVQALRQGVMSPASLKARADALWSVIRGPVLSDPRLAAGADPQAAKDSIGAYLDRRVTQLVAAGL